MKEKVISFILSLAMVFTMTTGLTALGFNAAADEVYANEYKPIKVPNEALGLTVDFVGSFLDAKECAADCIEKDGSGQAIYEYYFVYGGTEESYNCLIWHKGQTDWSGSATKSFSDLKELLNGEDAEKYRVYVIENPVEGDFYDSHIGWSFDKETGHLNVRVNDIADIPDSDYSTSGACNIPGPWQKYWNEKITSVSISGINRIGEDAFRYCENLESADINAKIIGVRAFGNTKLNNIKMEGVEKIEEYAFYKDDDIREIELPATLTTLDANALNSCGNFTKISFLGTTIPAIVGNNINLNSQWQETNPGCTVYVRPELVDAFASTVKINGENLTTSSRYHVESLPAIVWMSQDGSDFLKVDLINEMDADPRFYMPEDPTKDPDSGYLYVFNGWATAPNKESGESVDKLPLGPATYYAAFAKHLPTDAKDSGFFEGMKWKITYNDDFYAEGAVSDEVRTWFACRSSIKSVNVSNVNEFPGYAFKGASALTNVKLSEVKTINREAFEGCTALTSISIPASVTSMPSDDTFSGCTSLTAITFNGNRPSNLTGLKDLPANGVIKVKQEALESFTTGSAFTVNGRPVSTDAAVTEGWHYEFITAPSNHGGRGSSDSNPADKDAVKLGDATVAADVKISGDTAKVDSLAIEGLAAGGQVLSLDFSATAEVKKISLNKDILNKVQEGSEGLKLSVSGGNSQGSDLLQLKLDKEALCSLKNQANGDVTFAMQTGSEAISSMNKQQKETLNKLKNHVVIGITIEADGKMITKYGDGSIEISLTTPDLKNKAAAGVYLDKKGNLSAVKVVSGTDEKTILTNHLSHYMLVGVDSSTFEDVASNAFYKDAVSWAGTLGITAGTDDTHFSPSKDITRAEMVTFLWRAAGSPEPVAAATSFADIKENDYFYKAVLWAAEQGITTGTTATTFAPNEVITRGQAVSFLYRMNGIDTLDLKVNPFTDVKDGSYYTDAVLWAANDGITSGKTATTFAPEESCNRGQVVTFMYRYYNK